jgi:hypothetical protein
MLNTFELKCEWLRVRLPGFASLQGKEIFLFSTMPHRLWGPIQPPTQSIIATQTTSIIFKLFRNSVVGIATGYGLDDRGVEVRVPVGSRIFSSPRRPDRL